MTQNDQLKTPNPTASAVRIPASSSASVADAAGSGAIDGATRRKVVAASFIGNFVEWFDYAAYGYLAVTIAAVFFPSDDRQLALLMTFGVFAISFLVRPLGGFVWGHLGARIGRKEALSCTILLISGATPCIARLLGYARIGIAYPLLVVALRLVQGFSASGE